MAVSLRPCILAGILVVIVIATILLPTALFPTQESSAKLTCPPLPENDALLFDAQHYAADFEVSVEEAVCRLMIQDEIGPLGAALRSGEPQTYGGLWIHHEPEFGVTVLFTEDPEAALAPYVRGSALAGIVKARKSNVSLRYLEQAQNQAHAVASATGIPVESGINVAQNRVELYVIDIKGFTKALRSAGLRLPERVALIKVEQHSSPAS